VVAAIPAVVVEMVHASALPKRVALVPVRETIQAGRPCLLLRGTIRESDDIYVWPGDSHEICIDLEFGVVLKLEASFRGRTYATAEFTRVVFNAGLEADMFRRDGVAKRIW